MNSKGIVALTDHSVCMKCLSKKATHTYTICGRGYGSIFDGTDTKLQLCDNCHKDEYETWFNEDCTYNDYWADYTYEDNISELINSLPLEAQELFDNTFSSGLDSDFMNAQDWIDYKLGELPHDKCKEYGVYSPQEIKAYHDRFPTCNHVFLKTYSNGSVSCRCNYGAYGNKDGTCDINAYDECYQCTKYTPRVDKMKEINEIDEFVKSETSRLKDMLEYATTRLEVLNQGYEQYIEKFGE